MKNKRFDLKAVGLLCILTLCSLTPGHTAGDPIDGFDPDVTGSVNAIAVQSDGKILVGGDYTEISGVAKDSLARIDTDGTVEAAFVAGTTGSVRTIALQADGKILVGGSFLTFGGQTRQRIARVNANGTLDTSFNPGVGAPVEHIAVQADGKILVGGDFLTIGGEVRSRIARLLSDGTVDLGFNPGADSEVHMISVQDDGKILVGGDFTTLAGESRSMLGRLNENGTIDTDFDVPVAGTSGSFISAIAQRADGTIFIGGFFSTVDGQARSHFAVLSEDGTLNPALATGASVSSGVSEILPLRDGSVLVGGAFTQFEGGAASRIVKINRDLTVDATFAGSAGSNVTTLAQQKDGAVLVAGSFTTLGAASRGGFGRMSENGVVDDTFTNTADNSVTAIAIQEDGAIVVGGNFDNIDGTGRDKIARIDADGNLDSSFAPDVDDQVRAIVIQPNGKIIIGGLFNQVDSTTRNGIARLNADGSLDMSFDPNVGTIGRVFSMLLLPDGKIIIGGIFEEVGALSTPRDNLARLNSDGSLDSGFTNGTDGAVYGLGYQSDGKILVGGDFLVAGGQLRDNLARLSSEGVADDFNPSATPGSGLPGNGAQIYALLQQPDGKVLVAGVFEFIAGNSSRHIVRLNSDGSYDETFVPDFGFSDGILCLALQSNGDVIAGGGFSTVGSETRNNLVRLNSFGDVDANFDAGCDEIVNAIALRRDGKILIGGDFTTVDGETRTRLARLSNTFACSQLSENATNTGLEWTRKGSAPVVDNVDFSISDDDGLTWTPLGSGTWSVADSAWQQSTPFDLPVNQSILARVRGRQVSNVGFSAGSSNYEEIVDLFPKPIIIPQTTTPPTAKTPPTALINKLKKLKKKLKRFKKAGKRKQAKKLKSKIKRLKVQIAILS